MNLLLTDAFNYTDTQMKELENLGYEITFVKDERKILTFDVSTVDAVVCNGLFQHNNIEEFINLKCIQLTSAGMDRVPLDYINKRKIKLYNAKGVYSIPMAEWVVLKMLEIYKKSRLFHLGQTNRMWEKQRDLLELTNKTATIIGFGAVGSEVAKRLQAFNVNVIGVGRRQIDSPFIDEYYFINDLREALVKADMVILTVPLTEETRSLIDTEMINIMKKQCILINVSRGAVIDETALINALKEGKFYGVALDVFEEEPLETNNPLWGFENVIVTPHNSFVSDMNNTRMFDVIKSNLGALKI